MAQKLYQWNDTEQAYRLVHRSTLIGEYFESLLHALITIAALSWVAWLALA